MTKTYAVLDFETTGLDPKECQVTEIACEKVDEEFNTIGVFHTTVKLNKGQYLSDFIKKLTGLTEEDLSVGIKEGPAMRSLAAFIGDSIVVAQYASFDLSFLAPYKKPKRFYCTRSMSQLIWPGEKAGLKDITARLGVTLDGHHRAMNDVEATTLIFARMLDMFENKDSDPMNLMTERKDRPLGYIPEGTTVLKFQ